LCGKGNLLENVVINLGGCFFGIIFYAQFVCDFPIFKFNSEELAGWGWEI